MRRFLILLALVSTVLVTLSGGGVAQAQSGGTASVTLRAGWNTATYLGAAASVETALAPILERVDGVYRWDAGAQQWRSYNVAAPFLSDLTDLQPYDALFLHLTGGGSVTWTQAGSAPARSVALASGWNLVAWTGPDGTAPAAALGSVAASAVYTYIAGGGYLSYTAGLPGPLNSLTTLGFGSVLWVRTTAAGTWAQPAFGGLEALASGYASAARTGTDAQDAALAFVAQLEQAVSGVSDPAEIERLVGEAQARAIIANPAAEANLAITDASLNGFTTTVDVSGLFTAQATTPGVSVRFVNGVLNSNAGALSGAASLSGVLGPPVQLTYNHGVAEGGYGVAACTEALISEYPYYEEARAVSTQPQADGFFASAAAWASWVGSGISSAVGTVIDTGLSAACATIDFGLTVGNVTFQGGWDLLKNNAQLALQRTTNLDWASSTVNTQLVAAIKNEIACGKGVVLMGHSQGTLFIQNAYQQIQTWWAAEGRQLLNSSGEAPLGVLYISPAFDAINGGDQRYVRLADDILAATLVTISPPTATPTPTQKWPPYILPAQSLYLHMLSTYLEEGSASRAQIVSAYNDLRTLVQSRAAQGIVACGRLQATLTWNVPNDVDLYVDEPDGTRVSYRNTVGSVGALDRDDQTGTGPENYRVLEGASLQTGTYRIGVNYYASRTEGSVVATVTVTAEGTTISRSVTLSTPDRGASIVPVFTVEVTAAPAGSASPFTVRITPA